MKKVLITVLGLLVVGGGAYMLTQRRRFIEIAREAAGAR